MGSYYKIPMQLNKMITEIPIAYLCCFLRLYLTAGDKIPYACQCEFKLKDNAIPEIYFRYRGKSSHRQWLRASNNFSQHITKANIGLLSILL